MSANCLMTTVKNISGIRKKFGFLPPHGKELAANEEYSFQGTLDAGIARAGGYNSGKRMRDALRLALTGDEERDIDPTLDVLETPSPIFRDSRTDRSQILVVNNDTLALTNQCWDSE